jgi:hypothetical protein
MPMEQPDTAAENRQEIPHPSAPKINYAAGKTKKVIWIVSNCGSINNGRNNYVSELKK